MPDRELKTQFLFPEFTRASYRAAHGGAEAPPLDPSKPQKSWEDPGAANSARQFVLYDAALAVAQNGITPLLRNGRPYFEPLVLPRDQAIVVNLPPEFGSWQGETKPPRPVPCKPLAPNEVLIIPPGISGAVLIRDMNTWQEESIEGGSFTKADRDLLWRIAAKLGI